MAELTHRTVDIRRADRKIWFWIVHGWLDEFPVQKGVDTDLGIPGQVQGNRVDERNRLILAGHIEGAGATEAARQVDYRALLQSMLAVWDPSLAPGALVVADQYRGLVIGQTATIQVRTVNIIPADEFVGYRRKFSWELESISNPPRWVLAGP